MSSKKQLSLEYEMRSIAKNIYYYISSADGLSQWYAEKVTAKGDHYRFVWHNDEYTAKKIYAKENKSVKFLWTEDEPYYFELEILHLELSNTISLAVTDFISDENRSDRIAIWNNQIQSLQNLLSGQKRF